MSEASQPRADRPRAEGAPRVLLGHGGRIIAAAAQRILGAHGFEVGVASNARAVEEALAAGGWNALVIDVALPGGFELAAPARRAGVECVILVASVFRRTSYKRRPRRLYGADDYVEIHHLGDHLPNRLRAHLGLGPPDHPAETLREVLVSLRDRGDARLLEQSPRGLAALIVADLLLYNGDRVTDASSVDEAWAAVSEDLEDARKLFELLRPEATGAGELIADAFRELVASLDGARDSREQGGMT
ncbi:response regulator [Pseudenhygromyxa sp. WMMC2535]|uniref:response regulator n=1 Tax=Pseudenhygromyxa sp. WMMC2535 TaxID=2712867 RepID=UPI001595509E|nr:response regulator [Pseudenhygromyxa sp. WMMC2535]NVB42178.1 response regulator [Pseudenhygromyxa sp. WMMC2535]